MADSRWFVCCLMVLCPLINFGIASIFSPAPFQLIIKSLGWHLNQIDIDAVYPTVIVAHILIIIVLWIFICCCTFRINLMEEIVGDNTDAEQGTFEPDPDIDVPDSPGIIANEEIPPLYNEALHLSTSGPPTYEQILLTRQESFLTQAAQYYVRRSSAPLSPTSQVSFGTILEDSVFDDTSSDGVHVHTVEINQPRSSHTLAGNVITPHISNNTSRAIQDNNDINQDGIDENGNEDNNNTLEMPEQNRTEAFSSDNGAAASSSSNIGQGQILEGQGQSTERDMGVDDIDGQARRVRHSTAASTSNEEQVRFEDLSATSDIELVPNGNGGTIDQGNENNDQSSTIRNQTIVSNNSAVHSRVRLYDSSGARQQQCLLSRICGTVKRHCTSCCMFVTCNGDLKSCVGYSAFILLVLQFLITTALLFVFVSICGAGRSCADDMLKSCPLEGWVKYGGWCYKFMPQPKTQSYNESRVKCESYSNDATLLFILNKEEDAFLERVIMKFGGGLWRTGGHSTENKSKINNWPLYKNHYWYHTSSSKNFELTYSREIIPLRSSNSSISVNMHECLYIGTVQDSGYNWYKASCMGHYGHPQICRMSLDCGLSCYIIAATLSAILILLLILPCLSMFARWIFTRAFT